MKTAFYAGDLGIHGVQYFLMEFDDQGRFDIDKDKAWSRLLLWAVGWIGFLLSDDSL